MIIIKDNRFSIIVLHS